MSLLKRNRVQAIFRMSSRLRLRAITVVGKRRMVGEIPANGRVSSTRLASSPAPHWRHFWPGMVLQSMRAETRVQRANPISVREHSGHWSKALGDLMACVMVRYLLAGRRAG